jgi:hypothetical protein
VTSSTTRRKFSRVVRVPWRSVIVVVSPSRRRRAEGSRPMKEYRATCSLPSTDSNRNAPRAPSRSRRNAETGVKVSARTVRETGMTLWLAAKV